MRNLPRSAVYLSLNLPRKLTRQWLIGATLMTIGVSFIVAQAVIPAGLAQSCVANCGSRQIQFTPGQRIQISVVNRTSSPIQVEQIYGTLPISLSPSQEIAVDPNFGTRPNASIVVWDEKADPIRVVLFRPEVNQLRIEILPGGQPPGDRSVYIEDDGQVKIF
jgi:hypothetical protein